MRDAFAVLTSGTRKRRAEGSTRGVHKAASKSEGSRIATCPICGRQVHHALLESHAQECLESKPPKTAAGALHSPAAGGRERSEDGVGTQSASPASQNIIITRNTTDEKKSKANAFQVLLEGEKNR